MDKNSCELRVGSGENKFPLRGKLKALLISCLFVLFVVTVLTGFTYGVRRGVVAEWQYHGSVAASGTWYDLSGNNNNLLLQNDAFIDSFGLNLDGTGDNARVSGSLTNFDSFTFTAWIRTTDTASTITRKGGTNGGDDYFPLILFDVYSSGIRLAVSALENASDFTSIVGSTTINDNDWHMVTGVRDTSSGYLYLYVDGVSDATPVSDGSSGTISPYHNLGIGAYYTDTNIADFFTGQMKFIRFFNRALSAAEIKQLYYQTRGHCPTPPVSYVLVSDYFVSPLTFTENGTSNGKAKYVYDANNYIEWDGSTDWVIYLDDGIATQCFSITSATDTPPEAPANTWTVDYFFSMTSLTQQ
jgi:hypothetical protein